MIAAYQALTSTPQHTAATLLALVAFAVTVASVLVPGERGRS